MKYFVKLKIKLNLKMILVNYIFLAKFVIMINIHVHPVIMLAMFHIIIIKKLRINQILKVKNLLEIFTESKQCKNSKILKKTLIISILIVVLFTLLRKNKII